MLRSGSMFCDPISRLSIYPVIVITLCYSPLRSFKICLKALSKHGDRRTLCRNECSLFILKAIRLSDEQVAVLMLHSRISKSFNPGANTLCCINTAINHAAACHDSCFAGRARRYDSSWEGTRPPCYRPWVLEKNRLLWGSSEDFG